MALVDASGAAGAGAGVFAPPYAPSWVDRLDGWVRRLPLPALLVYTLPAIVLFAATTLIKWWDGTYPVGTFFPFHAVPQLVAFYGLALMHHLDNVAARALASFRPAMRIDDEHYRLLQYQLTTLPARPAAAAALLGALVSLGVIPLLTSQLGVQAKVLTSVPAAMIEIPVFILLWAVWWTVGYHTYRQLRLVNHIYTTYTHIDLLNLDPIYSFSWLTARTAVGWVLAAYAFLVTVPASMENMLGEAIVLGNFVFAVCAFTLPLFGVHRLIEAAKKTRIARSAERMEQVVADLHRRTAAGEYAGIAELDSAMEALARERDYLERIPTWPWRRETLSGFTTALVLPVVLWLITRVLDQFIGP